MYRKYFRSCVNYFLVYLFLPLIFFAASALTDIAYRMLVEIAPNLMPQYDRVLEKEQYEAFRRVMNAISALIAVFSISFLTGIYDNSRYEDVISRTDGLFKIRDEFSGYFKKYLPTDIIAAALPQIFFIPLTLPSYSKMFLDYLGGFLAPHLYLTELFSPILTYVAIFAAAIVGRLIAMPVALSRFRAMWLTSFVDS